MTLRIILGRGGYYVMKAETLEVVAEKLTYKKAKILVEELYTIEYDKQKNLDSRGQSKLGDW
ncbi:MAG: hypothetical protein A3F67_11790 [Verrucomicrobia bacterium RIFCSPHIGHO2_12_FULL_41_10]|nr:MAG: hypothetical protein A3F67_11790 [Verrucomicrobia bacterium RIFCSPHIGHO2_12_FULL_41_10]HLB57388.1 hypothetical protein [Gammaproteobacteria bacterium]